MPLFQYKAWQKYFFIFIGIVIIELFFGILGSYIFDIQLNATSLYKLLQIVFPLMMLFFAFYFFNTAQKQIDQQMMDMESWIEITDDSLLVINENAEVVYWNKNFQEFYRKMHDLKKGKNLLDILPRELLVTWRDAIHRARQGEDVILKTEPSEFYPFNEVVFHPLKQDDKVERISVLSKLPDDLGMQSKLLEEVQQRNEELKAQEEELRQNLEELQTTQDEMLVLQEELKDKEANLVALIDNLNDSMVSLDFKYKILSMNKSFVEHYESKGIDVKRGGNYIKILSQENAQERKKYIDKALEGNKFIVEEELDDVFLEVHYNPIKSDEGLTIGVAIFARDITERKQNEKTKQKLIRELEEQTNTLKESKEKLKISLAELQAVQKELIAKNDELVNKEARIRSVIDNASDGILAIDKDYNITIINRPLKERYQDLGLDLDVGYNVFTLIPPEQIPHWKSVCDKAMNGDTVNTIDKIRNRFFEVSLNPIYNDNKEIIGVAILTRDVSKQIKTAHKDIQTVDILKRIQERVVSINSEKEQEIESYRQKVEQLKHEIDKLKD